MLNGPPARMERFTPMLDAAADLLLGAACPGCGRAGLGPCQVCKRQLMTIQPIVRALNFPDGRFPVLVCHRYAAPISQLIIAHKEHGAWRLAGTFGAAIAARIGHQFDDHLLQQAILVPVPSDRAAERQRGYDHAAAIASAASRLLDVPMHALLRRVRSAGDQVGRGLAERQHAQHRTMAIRDASANLVGRRVIVVDDVVTSGATLSEAVRALTVGGLRPWFAVCLAAS